MNAITAKVTNGHKPLLTSLNHNRPIFSKPISSLSFKISYPSLSRSLSYAPIKASASNTSQNPKPLNPPPFPLLKTTAIAAVTATALLFSRFYFFKPAAATTVSPPPIVETQNDSVSEELREQEIEEHLVSNPNDVAALRSLMELRIKNKKLNEALAIIDRLIELEPDEVEWPLLKSHLYVHNNEPNSAKAGFYDIISKDPLRVDAYHGLVMASQDDSIEVLQEIEKRIDEGMKLAKKENKKTDLRDFKLLIAQIRVIEGKYDDALKVYEELVKEEPRDFRPYLCQGIIYTLLRKNNEAEKNFEKYHRLVPKGHPYAQYFDENMIATKNFSQKVGNDRVSLKS